MIFQVTKSPSLCERLGVVEADTEVAAAKSLGLRKPELGELESCNYWTNGTDNYILHEEKILTKPEDLLSERIPVSHPRI